MQYKIIVVNLVSRKILLLWSLLNNILMCIDVETHQTETCMIWSKVPNLVLVQNPVMFAFCKLRTFFSYDSWWVLHESCIVSILDHSLHKMISTSLCSWRKLAKCFIFQVIHLSLRNSLLCNDLISQQHVVVLRDQLFFNCFLLYRTFLPRTYDGKYAIFRSIAMKYIQE